MISIIIPTLNEEKVLEKTLQNLTGLETIPYEIIFSDGHSSDQTIATAKKYTDKIIVYRGHGRQGIAQGKNIGATIAQGNFLVFLDADVRIPEPDGFFKKILLIFQADEKLTGVTVALRVEPRMENFWDKIIFKIANTIFHISNNLLGKGASSGEFQMVRKKAFEEIKGFNEDLVVGEDNDLFLRLSRIGHTKMLSELTVFHTGRRAHSVGWPRLLIEWLSNWFFVIIIKKKAVSREWTEIR